MTYPNRHVGKEPQQMRLARIGAAGAEIPAVSDGDEWFDLRPITTDIDPVFLVDGPSRAAAGAKTSRAWN